MTPLEQARAKRAEAVSHKRQAAKHRREAQAIMVDLRTFCERYGIPFELVIVQEDIDEPDPDVRPDQVR